MTNLKRILTAASSLRSALLQIHRGGTDRFSRGQVRSLLLGLLLLGAAAQTAVADINVMPLLRPRLQSDMNAAGFNYTNGNFIIVTGAFVGPLSGTNLMLQTVGTNVFTPAAIQWLLSLAAGGGTSTTSLYSGTATNAMFATNGAPTGFTSVNSTNTGWLDTSNLNVRANLAASNFFGNFVGDTSKGTNIPVANIASTNGSAGQFVGWSSIGTKWLALPLTTASTFYAATNGSSSNTGLSTNSPWTLTYAIANAGASNAIVLMDGGPYSIVDLDTPAIHSGLTIRGLHKWKAFFSSSSVVHLYITEPGVSNCVVDGVRFVYAGSDDIKLYGGGTVQNCWVAGAGRTPGWTTNNSGSSVGNGILVSVLAGASTPVTILQNNLIESNGVTWDRDHGIYLECSNAIVRGNISRWNVGAALNFSGTYPVTGCQIYNNAFYGNARMDGPGEGTLCIYANEVNATSTNWFYGNYLQNTNGNYPVVNCIAGVAFFTNNIISASAYPGGGILFQAGASGVVDYNLATNSFSGIGLVDGGHNVITNAFGFVNPASGLYWPSSTSPARGAAVNQPGAVDFFGNPQNAISDIGPFQFNSTQASDTRTLDPSPPYGADYWTAPKLGDVTVFGRNVIGTLSNATAAALATNVVSGISITNPTVQITGSSDFDIAYNGVNLLQFSPVTSSGLMAITDINNKGIFLYTPLTDSLLLATEGGVRFSADQGSTLLTGPSLKSKLGIYTNRLDINTNVNAWALTGTNGVYSQGAVTGLTFSASSSTLGSLTTTSQATNQLGKSTFTNAPPSTILEEDSRGTVVGVSNLLDSQLSPNIPGLTNNNLWSGSNFYSGPVSLGVTARADSLVVTNGITNQSLSANSAVASDGSGRLVSIAGSANNVLHYGTPPAYSKVTENDLLFTIGVTADAGGLSHGLMPKGDGDPTHFYTGSGGGGTIAQTTIPDGALSANVPLKNGANSFSGVNGFAATTKMTSLTVTNGLTNQSLTANSSVYADLNGKLSSVPAGSAGQYLQYGTPPTFATVQGSQISGTVGSASTAGSATTLVPTATTTNNQFQIVGIGASQSVDMFYPNGIEAFQITTNGSISLHNLNNNPVLVYGILGDNLSIGKNAGLALFSSTASTKLYSGLGAERVTIGDASVVLETNTTVSGSLGYQLLIAPKTANYSVLAADSGTWFNNNGAVAAITNTLPASTPGLHYSFAVVTAQNLALKATGSDFIRSVGNISVPGGLAFSSTLGATLHLFCPATGGWWIDSTNGTWTIQ